MLAGHRVPCLACCLFIGFYHIVHWFPSTTRLVVCHKLESSKRGITNAGGPEAAFGKAGVLGICTLKIVWRYSDDKLPIRLPSPPRRLVWGGQLVADG